MLPSSISSFLHDFQFDPTNHIWSGTIEHSFICEDSRPEILSNKVKAYVELSRSSLPIIRWNENDLASACRGIGNDAKQLEKQLHSGPIDEHLDFENNIFKTSTSVLQPIKPLQFIQLRGDVDSNLTSSIGEAENVRKDDENPIVDEGGGAGENADQDPNEVVFDIADEKIMSEELKLMKTSDNANKDLIQLNIVANKLHFVGQCLRDYDGSSCPLNWEADEQSHCIPPSYYSGPCGKIKVDGPAAKEEMAWKCEAEWPCITIKLLMDRCPYGWVDIDGNGLWCRAKGLARDIAMRQRCTTIVNLEGWSNQQKSWWANECGQSFKEEFAYPSEKTDSGESLSHGANGGALFATPQKPKLSGGVDVHGNVKIST